MYECDIYFERWKLWLKLWKNKNTYIYLPLWVYFFSRPTKKNNEQCNIFLYMLNKECKARNAIIIHRRQPVERVCIAFRIRMNRRLSFSDKILFPPLLLSSELQSSHWNILSLSLSLSVAETWAINIEPLASLSWCCALRSLLMVLRCVLSARPGCVVEVSASKIS